MIINEQEYHEAESLLTHSHASMDARVEDYLNDKLQTLADFESLDLLIASVTSQQQLLKQQLVEAESDLHLAREASADHEASIANQATSFQSKQADIDKKLLIVTQSDTSEDAVARFGSSMVKLRTLDIANSYFETLRHVDSLSANAVSELEKAPRQAIAYYTQLHRLGQSLLPLHDAADGAAPHLLDHVGKCMDSTEKTIRDALASELEAILSKILWPKPSTSLPESLQQGFDDILIELLTLQQPDLEAKPASDPPAVLSPLDIMLRPISQRFHYHFSGDRPTNRLEKPEYFFSHVVDLLNNYVGFVSDHVQPALLRTFGASSLAAIPAYLDASAALITAMLPMLRTKLQSLVPRVVSQPKLLSHLVHELMRFDQLLRNEWRYQPASLNSSQQWQGLTHETLNKNNLFERWLQTETDFALTRYEAIIGDAGTSELDYDSVSPTASKPSKAAIMVHDLVAAITEHYRPLTSFSQKLRFLIDIQIQIFDKFHERLHSGLEAYLSLTSSIGRTVQGASAADHAVVQGVSGLERLCRIYSSAEYLERAMRDWSDDVFFLEMWTELQLRVQSGGKVAGNMSVSEVAQRTSATLDPDDDNTADPASSGALFDEPASAYGRLRARGETVIVENLVSAARETLRTYSRSASTWTLSNNGADDNLSISPDLAPLLSMLSQGFGFLRKALAPLPLRRISRAVGRNIDAYLWDRVVVTGKFSLGGTMQLRADVASIESAVGQAGFGLGRCRAALALLLLPQTSEDQTAENERPLLLLADVERRLFADNEQARAVLEALQLDGVLGEGEARQVIRCRIEVDG